MAAEYNVVWEQGEDFQMHMQYTKNGQPVDMTGYSVRMDIAPTVGAAPIFTLNSDDITGVDDEGNPLDVVGIADNEIVTDIDGNIDITINRQITLPGGAMGNRLAANTKYVYDIFIRENSSNLQRKLAHGSITVNRSVTLWL